MRLVLALIAAIVICDRDYHPANPPPAPAPRPAPVDFKTSIQPILQKKCSPCHFEGGVMHARLPFDKPETIVKLGTRLFSRIKDEESRATIREFLSQNKRAHGE